MQYIDFKLQIYACVPARPFIYRSAMSELYMSGLCVITIVSLTNQQ